MGWPAGGFGTLRLLTTTGCRAEQACLLDEAVHPRAAALVAACVPVDDEQAVLRAVAVEHLEHAHVFLVRRQVLALLEAQAVQLTRREQHAVDQHAIHFEVRSHLGFVVGIARPAHLFGIEIPIPRFQFERSSAVRFRLCVDQRLDVRCFALRIRDGRRCELAQHAVHGARIERSFIFEDVSSVAAVAEQRGALGPQLHDLRDLGRRVELAAPAAVDRCAIDTLAQRAILELGERRLRRRIEQCDDPFAFELALLRSFRGDGDLLVRQAVELGARVDDDGGRVHALEHRLPELGRELRDLLVQVL